MANTKHHESLDRVEQVKGSSERSFGLVIAAFLLIVGAVRAWYGSGWIGWIVAAIPFAILAIVAPAILRPLNRLWLKFGLLLHHIVSPLILGLLYFAIITPTSLLMRLFGKRPLQLKFDQQARTYWTRREPPGPDPTTMNNQF